MEHIYVRSNADDQLSREIVNDLMSPDDGQAAKSHLAAGRPIYYCDDSYPDDFVRKWSGGRRELVTVDDAGNITVIKALEAEL